MTQWHGKSKRKKSGGIRKTLRARDKQLAEKGGLFTSTQLDVNAKENKIVVDRTRGGNSKSRVQRAKTANVLDPTHHKFSSMEIVQVKENNANRDYARRNIITKGAILELKKGTETVLARVTSRTGQNGSVNAVLIKK